MIEKENIINSERSFYMSPQDHLLLHQLNLLKWLDSKNTFNDNNLYEKTTTKSRLSDMPDKWQLIQGISLYEWQESCIEKWFKNKRGTIKVVTGAGKTILALAIIEWLQNTLVPDLHVAIVVPTIVLMNQWYDEIADKGNLPIDVIGRLGGGYKFEGVGVRSTLLTEVI